MKDSGFFSSCPRGFLGSDCQVPDCQVPDCDAPISKAGADACFSCSESFYRVRTGASLPTEEKQWAMAREERVDIGIAKK